VLLRVCWCQLFQGGWGGGCKGPWCDGVDNLHGRGCDMHYSMKATWLGRGAAMQIPASVGEGEEVWSATLVVKFPSLAHSSMVVGGHDGPQ
jgi:hypothetical protein